MTTDVSQKIRDLLDAAIQAAKLLSARSGLPLEYSHIESALLLEMELDSSTDLLEKQLDKEQIVATLTRFNSSASSQRCYRSSVSKSPSSLIKHRANLRRSLFVPMERYGRSIRMMLTLSPPTHTPTTVRNA